MTRKLSKEQEAEIFRLISTRRPFQLGFKLPYKKAKLFLWTRHLLKQLIKKKYQIELADGVVLNYLIRWGVTPLNRGESKHDQCHIAIGEWLVEHGKVMLARSKNEKVPIYWMGDIAVIGLQDIDRSRGRRLTMIPMIENQGRVHWLTISGAFNAERQVMLLKSLIGQTNSKVFLIRKTETHFKTKLVKDWLNANKANIEIFPPLDVAIESIT